MRKLIFIAMAAGSYCIAGMYRQMPLMVLAVMEWILLVCLFFLPRCLQRNLTVSFPVQSDEAEKGSGKKCLLHIGRSGVLPLKRVCVELKVYDDEGVLIQKMKKKKTIDALTGTVDFEVFFSRCGILRVQICKVYLYDYLSVFSSARIVHEDVDKQMKFFVLPRTRRLQVQPGSTKSVADQPQESSGESKIYYTGEENGEIRQIREYRTGDAMRHIHWNQSAKTEKLWAKEFERKDECSCEILLDMMLPENWKPEERDGFYEVVSAVLLGFVQGGNSVRVSWYDGKSSGFVTAEVEDWMDYRNMMRKFYQSEFVKKTEIVERAYEKKQASLHPGLLKCNLRLECYEIKGFGVEELRHRFTYENLEQELSADSIFSLW